MCVWAHCPVGEPTFFSHLAVVGGSLIHSQRDEATTTMLCRWYSVLRFESLTFNHISFIFFEG